MTRTHLRSADHSKTTSLLAVALFVAAGCASSQRPERKSYTVHDYYPAAVGNAWAYDIVRADTAEPVLSTSKMTAVSGDAFELTTGDQVVRYERRAEGIFKPKSEYFALKGPLVAGVTWKMPEGLVSVKSVDATVKVKSGRFDQCVVIVEEVPGRERATWTYAPQVGPVSLELLDLSTNPPTVVVKAELRGYAVAPKSVPVAMQK